MLEDCNIPIILQHIEYIDYYHQGPNVTIKQIVDVINGCNTFTPRKNFSNATAYFKIENGVTKVRIEAAYYMEPHAMGAIVVKNPTNDIDVQVKGFSLPTEKFDNIEIMPNYKSNVIKVSRTDPITKDFPFRFEIKTISGNSILVEAVLIRVGEERFKSIPMKDEN